MASTSRLSVMICVARGPRAEEDAGVVVWPVPLGPYLAGQGESSTNRPGGIRGLEPNHRDQLRPAEPAVRWPRRME